MFIRISRLFFLCVIMIACSEKSNLNKDGLFYLVTYTKNGDFKTEIDTVNKALKHDVRDTLLFSKVFQINNKYHEIRKYTNMNYCPVDGEIVLYEVDSIGVFYSCELSWNTFKKLKSSNDSLNEIIDLGLQNIIRFNDQKYLNQTFESNRVVVFDSPTK